jgi:hypothetical protein
MLFLFSNLLGNEFSSCYIIGGGYLIANKMNVIFLSCADLYL